MNAVSSSAPGWLRPVAEQLAPGWAWADVQIVARWSSGAAHLIPCRCIVRVEHDGDRAVYVPYYRSWALRAHGVLSVN